MKLRKEIPVLWPLLINGAVLQQQCQLAHLRNSITKLYNFIKPGPNIQLPHNHNYCVYGNQCSWPESSLSAFSKEKKQGERQLRL